MSCGADGRSVGGRRSAVGVRSRDCQIFWDGLIYLAMVLRPRARFAREWSSAIKQGKMGTETSKIALNTHVYLRTANQQMSRPERHVDDMTDMRKSCKLRENTSGRRPFGSSSRLLKVPNIY